MIGLRPGQALCVCVVPLEEAKPTRPSGHMLLSQQGHLRGTRMR